MTPFTPAYDKDHQYSTISKHNDHRYINNLPWLLGNSKDVPELSATFTQGGKRVQEFWFCQRFPEGGGVEALCEIMQEGFSSKAARSKVEWENGKRAYGGRQQSKGYYFRAQRCKIYSLNSVILYGVLYHQIMSAWSTFLSVPFTTVTKISESNLIFILFKWCP